MGSLAQIFCVAPRGDGEVYIYIYNLLLHYHHHHHHESRGPQGYCIHYSGSIYGCGVRVRVCDYGSMGESVSGVGCVGMSIGVARVGVGGGKVA